MPVADIPANEADRIAAVNSYHLIDSMAEEAFDEINRLASVICEKPIALISLIDDERQWFKSIIGLAASETPRRDTICQHTILQDELLEIEDSSLDPRTADNPSVLGGPQVRHYAGVTLRSDDGFNIGTFCVIDNKPGKLTELQRQSLRVLANQAMRLMEFRRLSLNYKKISDRYSALYDHSPIAEIVTDNNGAIVDANQGAVRLFMAEREAMIGKRLLYDSLDEASRQIAAQMRGTLDQQGFAEGTELRIKDAVQNWLTVLANTVILKDESGNRTGAHITLQDVSRLKAVEAALIEARLIAESANAAKSEFLAVMSHEIRTPLNGLIGMVGILADTTLTEAQRRYLGIIERSAELLLNVIGNVLDFSKLQANAMERADEAFDLNAAVRDTLDIYAARAAEKSVELLFAPDAVAPRFVVTDAGKFKQILLNLISNALKFTERGHVKISVSATIDADTKISVAVSDTGCGMTPEQVDRLFKAYAQADSHIAGKFGGTGLGLSISRQLAELLGGSLNVTSRYGQGTTFTLLLPVSFDEAREKEFEQKFQHEKPLAGRSLLLVDNQQINHEIVQHHLAGLEMVIGKASGGAEALAYVARTAVDVALIDLNMPDMNGIELAAELTRTSPAVGRILLSSLPVSRSLITEGVFHATLVKPVNRSELLEILQRVLARLDAHLPGAATEKALVGKTVLVVEDDAVNQTITGMTLEKLGATFRVVGTGAEAIRLAAEENYSFVLLDMHLPDLDGRSIAAQIARARPALPIIAYSADIALLSRKDLKAYGIAAQMAKPVTLGQFVICLERAGLIECSL